MKPDRCLPVCPFTSCRLFEFSADELIIQESGQGVIFPPEYPADLIQKISLNADKSHLTVITTKLNQTSVVEEYKRIQ